MGKRNQKDLKDVEEVLHKLFDQNSCVVSSKESKRLKDLEGKKKELLEMEVTWRLKSRAIWLAEGDNYTTFFHKYTAYK